MRFDGFHLPGLDTAQLGEWRYLEHHELRVRWPVLNAEQITRVWQHLTDRRNRVLLATPVEQIVQAIDEAVRHMQRDAGATIELVSAATGYTQAVVTETLEHMFRDWRADGLHTLLRSELGDARVLDHAIADPVVPGKQIAAFGFPRVLHIFSGNVPGVAVTSLIRSLLVKSATLAKSAAGEPVLPIVFVRALQAAAPALGECLAVTYWPGGDAAMDEPAARQADAVVVYGGSEAVTSYRRAGEGKHLVVHGPKLSFGIVGEVDEKVAYDVARAVTAYDQQGCVSPHLVYVVGDDRKARSLAHAVAGVLRTLATDLPRGRLSAEEAVAIRNARTAAEFGTDTEVVGREQDSFVVIFEQDPAFRASCLNRVLYVKPIRSVQDLLPQLPDAQHLQSVALAGFADAEKTGLARTLGLAGVARITSFARLPWPPMDWHHDGSAPLRELIRWQDVEPD